MSHISIILVFYEIKGVLGSRPAASICYYLNCRSFSIWLLVSDPNGQEPKTEACMDASCMPG